MGCNCSKDEKYDPSKGDSKEIDASSITDPHQKVEKSYPFYRMHVKAFEDKVNSIGKDNIPIEELAAALSTSAWAGKFGEGQPLNALLESLPNSGSGLVDKISLQALGLLWCDGGVKDKTEVLFGIINPVGQAQDGVTASDKEFKMLLESIFLLASYWTEALYESLCTGDEGK